MKAITMSFIGYVVETKGKAGKTLACPPLSSLINKKHNITPADFVCTTETDDKQLIYFSNVSNAMHVMLGCRPVAAKREIYQGRPSNIKRIKRIDEFAKSGVIKITNIPTREFVQGKKPFLNSERQYETTILNNGVSVKGKVNWDTLEKKELSMGYPESESNLARILNWAKSHNIDNPKKKYTLLEMLSLMREQTPENERGSLFAGTAASKPFNDFMVGDSANFSGLTQYNGENYAARFNNVAPKTMISVVGELTIVVSDEDAKLFENSKQIASFLEDGYIRIIKIEHTECTAEDIVEELMMSDDRYQRIKDLPRFKGDIDEN